MLASQTFIARSLFAGMGPSAEKLRELGISCDDSVLLRLSVWLAEQEFDCLEDVRECGPLSDLPGSNQFEDAVLAGLLRLAPTRPKARLRVPPVSLAAEATTRPVKRPRETSAFAALRYAATPFMCLFRLTALLCSTRSGLAAQSEEETILAMIDTPSLLVDITGLGPRAALDHMHTDMPKDSEARERWWADARVSAIMGSCPKTRDSVKSGAHPFPY